MCYNFIISLTSNSIQQIQILKIKRISNNDKSQCATKFVYVSMKNHIREKILTTFFGSSRISQKDRHALNTINSSDYLDNIQKDIESELYSPNANIKLKDNSYYHFGWKQIYNKFFFFDVDQKCRKLNLFKNQTKPIKFYQLDKLVLLLKSDDITFTMTTFSFILFSVTKSLYKVPKNSSIKDIKLSVMLNQENNKNNAIVFLENIIQTIVSCNISFDFSNGQPHKDIIKEFNKAKASSRLFQQKINGKDYADITHSKEFIKIQRTSYTANYEDYPIIICNRTNSNHYPNKCFYSFSASPIYIDFIDNNLTKCSMYIPVFPQTCLSLDKKTPETQYVSFLEDKLSSEADYKYRLKNVSEKLYDKINKIIYKPDELLIPIEETDVTKILNCLFNIYFHKNQKITYFDDLYKKALEQLSFPNCNRELAKNYSYLLASLMSFKEYVDELPPISPYYDPDDESYQPHNFKNNTKHSYGLESDYYNFFIDNNDDNDYEEYTPLSDPPIIDITPYKQEFYDLFDQTVEIFKKRCAADNNADINISYDDKLIQLFDCFITKLINEDSNIIIKPAKTKQGLIFLDFHSYFEHFELFLEKQNFHYSISKQKFNRLLYDNKILKPRYNGSDKTPPKLDYILQINEQKYTVLAIKLDILKAKISELSK